jgi:hypothetical protein
VVVILEEVRVFLLMVKVVSIRSGVGKLVLESVIEEVVLDLVSLDPLM